jgi:hypothetical protein
MIKEIRMAVRKIMKFYELTGKALEDDMVSEVMEVIKEQLQKEKSK